LKHGTSGKRATPRGCSATKVVKARARRDRTKKASAETTHARADRAKNTSVATGGDIHGLSKMFQV